jgi:antitoxin component YwqK of YwqJK toxin-antitoxin module
LRFCRGTGASHRYDHPVRGLVLIMGVCAPACGSSKTPPPPQAEPAPAPAVARAPAVDAAVDDAPTASAISQLPGDAAPPYKAQGDADSARSLLAQARRAVRDGDDAKAIRLFTDALAKDPSDTRARYELATRYAATGDPRALALLAELTLARCEGCLAFRQDARWRDEWQPLWDTDAMFEILAYRRPEDPATAEATLADESEDRPASSPITCPPGTHQTGTWRANRIDDEGEVWCVKPNRARHGPYYKLDTDHAPGDVTQEVAGEYRNGKRHGLWRTALSLGDSSEGAYVDDKPRGVWTELGREQITFSVYVDGKLHGRRLQIIDDELHHVLSDERYDRGVLDGPVRHYQEQPWTLWESGSYVQGKKHGEWLYFDEDGRKRIRESWNQGVPDGAFELWDAGGKLVDRTELVAGTGRWFAHDTSGRKLAEGALTDNKKTGVWGELAEDNTGWDTGAYHGGVATGVWQQLASPGGPKLAEGSYAAGQRSGAWTFWRPDGTLRARGGFRAGRPDGAWTIFDDDGKTPAQTLGFRAGVLTSVDGVRATRAWRRGARRVRFERAPQPVAPVAVAPDEL